MTTLNSKTNGENMNNFFLDLHRLLSVGQRLVIARIIRQKGSAPRSIGTQCIILETGKILGTIGGGILEYQVVEKAREVLEEGRSAVLHFQLTGEDVAATDMLCGGIMDVFLEPVSSDNQMANDVFAEAGALITEAKKKGTLLTVVEEGIGQDRQDGRALITGDAAGIKIIGRIAGGDDIDADKLIKVQSPALMQFHAEGPSIFVEPIRAADVLYIFGAGHISTFLSPLAKRVGFSVVVIDDREEFANKKRFPDADEIRVMPFLQSFDRLAAAPSAYIAIITRGHIHDHAVLREALKHEVAYIGMVGSRKKRETIYQALIKEGTPKEILETVHAPIGLAIGAQTPEEIAVSIVAELIQERDRLKKKMVK